MALRVKEGVNLNGLQYNIVKAIPIIVLVFEGFNVDAVITAGLDGEHMIGSKHYSGEAADFRRFHLPDHEIIAPEVKKALKYELGNEYDVVLHHSHFHIEYDPKG